MTVSGKIGGVSISGSGYHIPISNIPASSEGTITVDQDCEIKMGW